jgi:WD40 repeat protein
MWDVATEQQVLSLKGFSGQVISLAFNPAGTRLVAGGFEGNAVQIRVWDATPLGNKEKGTDEKSRKARTRLWHAPWLIEGDPERILLWAQVITGLELDEYGGTRGLDAATWEQRRQRLQKLGGPPEN